MADIKTSTITNKQYELHNIQDIVVDVIDVFIKYKHEKNNFK